MKRATLVIAAASLLLLTIAGPAPALDIPLDDLEGDYEMLVGLEPDFGWPFERTTEITFPDDLAGIDEVVLLVSGHWTAGVVTCEQPDGSSWDFPFLPSLRLELTADAFGEDSFVAYEFPLPEGEFWNLPIDLSSCCPVGVLSLDELIGTTVTAVLTIQEFIVGMCVNTVDPYGSLWEARLQVAETVGVSETTWSAVKALYE